jgi:protease-4
MEKKVSVSFWRIFWPSLVASLAIVILLVLFFFGILGSMFDAKPFSVKDGTVLHMRLSGEVGDVTKSEFSPSSLSMDQQTGLVDLLYGLERAAEDKKIKGVFIELENTQFGFATATELRKGILKFKESGKFVIAYLKGEAVGIKQYYLASTADEIYGFPSTMFDFGGLGAELMFFKGMFDKLDLEMQVIRGSDNDFKSAVEPYFLERMSDSSRLQIERYLTSMWEDIRLQIATSRQLNVDELNTIADSTLIRRMTDAVKYKLIDDTKYRDEVLAILVEKTGVADVDKLQLTTLAKYATNKFENNQKIVEGKSNASIAVIVAEGGIATSGDGIASNKLTKVIRDARNDKNIKAIVLRVNSPGGSALASDEIWREIILTKEQKPVIVSMGDVAASGGYYIAAPANRIFAEPMTITGSIGVFGVIPYTGKMFENKLGLSFDRVSTNARSVLSLNKKLSPEEFAIVQEEVDFIYDEFLMRVAEGRGMTKEQVHRVARGRVWTGKDALAIGLVDELGGLRDAIAYAAKEIGAEKYEVQYLPKRKKDPLQEILAALDNSDDESNQKGAPEELLKYYRMLMNIEKYTGIQARLPYDIVIR